MPKLRSKPLIQNGRIVLHPAPNGDVVHRQAPFRHHFFQVAVGKRVPQIPPHAQNNNHVLEVSPSKQCRAVLAHRLTLPDPPIRFLQQILQADSVRLSLALFCARNILAHQRRYDLIEIFKNVGMRRCAELSDLVRYRKGGPILIS